MSDSATDRGHLHNCEAPGKYLHIGFFELLADAIFHLKASKVADTSYSLNRSARASMIASAFALESFANCLLRGSNLSSKLNDEVDRLGPLSKIEMFLKLEGIERFDRGKTEVQQASEIIKLRNDFVHPKECEMPTGFGPLENQGELHALPVSFSPSFHHALNIPKSPLFWTDKNAETVLKAVVRFMHYVLCDLMQVNAEKANKILSSRFLLGNLSIVCPFDDILAELNGASKFGIDFSFLNGSD